MNMTQDVINAVKEAKEQSKPRNFTESVDVIINIRDLDVRKPENRFNEEVTLPNGRGKEVKIGVIADGELIVQAKNAGLDLVINKADLEAFGKDRKSAKKAANTVDFFIAQADMMPLVGRFLGPVLGPRGKMPKPVPASIKLDPLLERLQSTVKVGVKQQASVQIVVGSQDMSDEDIAENRPQFRKRKKSNQVHVYKNNYGTSSEGDLMAHVAEWKKEEVKELSEIINQYDVIGIVDLMNIPAKQLQEMRKSLNEKAVIRMSKKNLIDLALEDCNADKNNIVDLSGHMDGQVAIIATEMNPFKLFKILEDSKTSAPAKPGTIAPDDIIVPEGDTGFEPGPFLGELQQVGIPAKIDKGKICVQKETVVVAAGDEVSKQVAATLARMDINPMEVGIDLKAVYEEGSVYTSDVLAIDEEQTLADVQKAFSGAFNLSVNAAIPTTKTISTILSLAHTRAVSVGVEGAILTSKTSEPILGLVNARMLAIASAIADTEGAIDDELADKLSNVAVAAAPVVEEEVVEEEEEEEEEESSEEEAAAGLGALFG